MSQADADDIGARLRALVQGGDWEAVCELIEVDWPVLVGFEIHALDEALRVLPRDEWLARPTVAGVREMRLNVQGDTTDLDRAARRANLPSQKDQLRELGRSANARRAMSTASALMIAYRLHGQHRKARHFAHITEELTRHTRVHHPQEIAIRVPSALLQVGITMLLAGDFARARSLLQEAYELRHESWDSRVERDSAGKLALLYAVEGDTVEAERWLARHRDSAPVHGWMVALVDLSASVATALIAVDRLDNSAAVAALGAVELQVGRERSWAPFVTYVHARYDLYWGDHRSALERIEQTRAFTGAQHRKAGIEPRLDAVKANLLLALERPHDAQAVLAQREDSPHVFSVAARLSLMSGRSALSREISATGLATSDLDPRARVDLLLVAALAEDSPERARRLLRQAVATSTRTRTVAPFALADRSSLLTLSRNTLSTTDHSWVESILSSAPEPLPATVELIKLTSTEQRILQLLADGASKPQMVHALFVSENTVKFHLRNLYRKLGVASRADAVTKGHQLRLVGPTA